MNLFLAAKSNTDWLPEEKINQELIKKSLYVDPLKNHELVANLQYFQALTNFVFFVKKSFWARLIPYRTCWGLTVAECFGYFICVVSLPLPLRQLPALINQGQKFEVGFMF